MEEFSQAAKPADTELFLAAICARQNLNEIAARVTQDDFDRWKGLTNQSDAELLNDIASTLALGFQARDLDFSFCDMVVNTLDKFADRGDRSIDLFWEVWHAFDGGEFYREGKMEEEPSEIYTRPEIEKIVTNLKNRS